jgi:hypothetical protein
LSDGIAATATARIAAAGTSDRRPVKITRSAMWRPAAKALELIQIGSIVMRGGLSHDQKSRGSRKLPGDDFAAASMNCSRPFIRVRRGHDRDEAAVVGRQAKLGPRMAVRARAER